MYAVLPSGSAVRMSLLAEIVKLCVTVYKWSEITCNCLCCLVQSSFISFSGLLLLFTPLGYNVVVSSLKCWKLGLSDALVQTSCMAQTSLISPGACANVLAFYFTLLFFCLEMPSEQPDSADTVGLYSEERYEWAQTGWRIRWRSVNTECYCCSLRIWPRSRRRLKVER